MLPLYGWYPNHQMLCQFDKTLRVDTHLITTLPFLKWHQLVQKEQFKMWQSKGNMFIIPMSLRHCIPVPDSHCFAKIFDTYSLVYSF